MVEAWSRPTTGPLYADHRLWFLFVLRGKHKGENCWYNHAWGCELCSRGHITHVNVTRWECKNVTVLSVHLVTFVHSLSYSTNGYISAELEVYVGESQSNAPRIGLLRWQTVVDLAVWLTGNRSNAIFDVWPSIFSGDQYGGRGGHSNVYQ